MEKYVKILRPSSIPGTGKLNKLKNRFSFYVGEICCDDKQNFVEIVFVYFSQNVS